MGAEKYSASMDDQQLAAARAAAEREGVSLSSWLTDAVAHQLRLRALEEVVAEWEAEHGAITVEELSAVEQRIATARRTGARRKAPKSQAS